jgi:hypothetical protein
MGRSALVHDAVSAERGFRSIKYIDEKPLLDEFAAGDLASMTTRKFRPQSARSSSL